MEYAPIDGLANFRKAVQEVAFGAQLVKDHFIATVQTISGTGSLRVCAEFLRRFASKDSNQTVYVPSPTWANHRPIIHDAGMRTVEYRHLSPSKTGFDCKSCLEDIVNAPEGSIFLFHSCAHNPTGEDPSPDEWAQIACACQEKKHLVWFDSAYQGFSSGDLDQDAESFRMFTRMGVQVMLSQSLSKNMGLYGQRTGALHLVCRSQLERDTVLSQLKKIIRPMYSNPPIHGARIATEVLNNVQLRNEWMVELTSMANRMREMRKALFDELIKLGSKRSWDHLTRQVGMFCYTGLTPEQIDKITNEYAIYLTKDGRISITGLNHFNVKHVAAGLHATTQ